MVGPQHLLAPRCRSSARLQERPEHAHGCKRELEILHACERKRLGQQLDHLGISLGTLFADALDADLRHLARLGLHLRFGLAKHALHVAEPERPRLPGETRRAHAGHLQRHIGPHGQQVATCVEELERRPGHAPSSAKHIHDFECRSLDGGIAARGETRLHVSSDALACDGLVDEHVPESCRCHVVHILFLFGFARASTLRFDGRAIHHILYHSRVLKQPVFYLLPCSVRRCTSASLWLRRTRRR